MVLSPSALDNESLLERYVEVANKALEAHEHEFPYKHILRTAEQVLKDQPIGVEIYQDDPGQPVGHHTIYMNNGRIQMVPGETPGMEPTWHVKRRYLEKVVGDPQKYIRDPVNLDWEWLKTRLGLGQP